MEVIADTDFDGKSSIADLGANFTMRLSGDPHRFGGGPGARAGAIGPIAQLRRHRKVT